MLALRVWGGGAAVGVEGDGVGCGVPLGPELHVLPHYIVLEFPQVVVIGEPSLQGVVLLGGGGRGPMRMLAIGYQFLVVGFSIIEVEGHGVEGNPLGVELYVGSYRAGG